MESSEDDRELEALKRRMEHLEAGLDRYSLRSGPAQSSIELRNSLRAQKSAAGWLQIGVRMVAELVAGVLAGAALGALLDWLLEFSPVFFSIFILLGFIAGVLNVLRFARTWGK